LAVLRQHGGFGKWEVTITPVWPTLDGPQDAYDVTLTTEGKMVYSRRQSGQEWVTGRRYRIDKLAHAFQYAGLVIDAQDSINLAEEVAWFDKHLFVHEDAYWIEIVFQGRTNARGVKIITLNCFLRIDPDPETGLERFVVTRFACSAAECEQFGITLRAECDAVEARSKELGFVLEDDED
jgi:hypothetical protein